MVESNNECLSDKGNDDEYKNLYEPEIQGSGTGGQGQQGQVCPVQINQEQEIVTENRVMLEGNTNNDRFDIGHISGDESVVSSESRQSF